MAVVVLNADTGASEKSPICPQVHERHRPAVPADRVHVDVGRTPTRLGVDAVDVRALLGIHLAVVLLRRGDVGVLRHHLLRTAREVLAEQLGEGLGTLHVALDHRHLQGAGVQVRAEGTVHGRRRQRVAAAHRQRVRLAGGDRTGVPGRRRVRRQIGRGQEAGRALRGSGRNGPHRHARRGHHGGHRQQLHVHTHTHHRHLPTSDASAHRSAPTGPPHGDLRPVRPAGPRTRCPRARHGSVRHVTERQQPYAARESGCGTVSAWAGRTRCRCRARG